MALGNWNASNDLFFKVVLRDVNPDMVAAWQDSEAFGEDKFTDLVEVRSSSQVHCSLVHTKNLILIRSLVETSLKVPQPQMQL